VADVLLSLLLVVATLTAVAAVLWLMARFVGLGRCLDCRRGCPPWSVYCWRHDPFGEVD